MVCFIATKGQIPLRYPARCSRLQTISRTS